VLGVWQLVYIAAAVPCGALLDRLGARPAVFIGALFIAASGALRGVAIDFWTLCLAVGLFGIGGPLVSAGAPKVVAQWFKGSARGMAMGIYITGPAIGAIVALSLSNSVLMPWLDDVAAVLQVWFPGERFGDALAAVLFGDAEPGGRLPLTFPHARRDLPGGDHGPGAAPTELHYDADGGIGYRAPGIRERGALFAFGHGLGYAETRCAVTASEVINDELRLSLTIGNAGARDTVHVVQCYAELPGEAPELVHVQRVPVAAGQTVEALARIGVDAFSRWHGPSERRVAVDGSHHLRVATSSADPGTSIGLAIVGGHLNG
jgi:hypothetical protein